MATLHIVPHSTSEGPTRCLNCDANIAELSKASGGVTYTSFPEVWFADSERCIAPTRLALEKDRDDAIAAAAVAARSLRAACAIQLAEGMAERLEMMAPKAVELLHYRSMHPKTRTTPATLHPYVPAFRDVPILIESPVTISRTRDLEERANRALGIAKRVLGPRPVLRHIGPIASILVSTLDDTLTVSAAAIVPGLDPNAETFRQPIEVASRGGFVGLDTLEHAVNDDERAGLIARAIERAVTDILRHEVEEGIFIDGKRPLDPHRKDCR
jgi:hypothetical protein